MTAEEFWRVVDRVTALPFEDRVRALEDLLAELHPDDLTGFADTLEDILIHLETPAHAEACHAQGDSFLYIRCAAVLAGSARFATIVADPRLLADFEQFEAEDLLFAASNAYERTTGLPWEHHLTSDDSPDGWLRFAIDISGYLFADSLAGGLPVETEFDIAYRLAQDRISSALSESDVWSAWWRLTGTDELSASLHLDQQPPIPFALRKGKRIVELQVPATGGRGATSAAGSSPATKAADDIRVVLTVARDKLGLPPFPPLPGVPPPTAAEVAAELQARREDAASFQTTMEYIREYYRSQGIDPDF